VVCTGNVLREILNHRNYAAVNVNAVNVTDDVAMETPLHKALQYNMLENVELLIRAGSDVNIANVIGETCMHCAARRLTDLSLWNALIKAHGDITARKKDGWTVRRIADEAKNLVARSVLAQCDTEFTTV
jgi:ankyrin repeat protein